MVKKQEKEEVKLEDLEEEPNKKLENPEEEREKPAEGEEDKDVKKEPVKEKKVEKQLLKIIGFFAILVLVFFVASEVFKEMQKVEYEGITFTRGKYLGDIEAYHYPYYLKQDVQLVKYNLYVRNNPAENDVPIDGDEIILDGGSKPVYISLDTLGLRECEQSIIAVADLSSFLVGNGLTVKSGSVNEEEAEKTGKDYVTCEDKPKDKSTVIELLAGEETKITIVDRDCYRITVANCDILKATEKFEVHSLLDAGINKFK